MKEIMQTSVDADFGRNRDRGSILSENRRLERHSWRNWILLSAVTIITTFGLVTAMPPLLDERITESWPWAKTDLVLLVGLSLIVLVFIVYLTQHQRHIRRIRENLEELREDREEYIRMQNSRLSAMCKVSGLIGIETDVEKVFDGITRICFNTFQCYRASLMLVDNETDELVVRSIMGYADEDMFTVRRKIGEGIAGWCALHRKSLLLGNSLIDEKKYGFSLNNSAVTSAMVVPIIVRDELVGVLNVSSRDKSILYTEEDLKVLTVFAENAGTCIRHTEHTEWMRDVVRKVRHKITDEDMDIDTRRELETIE